MLQLSVLRNDPAFVKERLAVKHCKQLDLVDSIIALDDQRKKLQLDFDTTQAKVNAASKEIGKMMASGNAAGAEAIKQEVAGWKESLDPIKTQMAEIETSLTNQLLQLPNLPGAPVPIGKTPEDNVVVKTGGPTATLPTGAMPHWDLSLIHI